MASIILTDAHHAPLGRKGHPWYVCARISPRSTEKGNWVHVGTVYAMTRFQASLEMCERFATDGVCLVAPLEAQRFLGVLNPDWERFGGKRHPGLTRLKRR